MSNELNAVSLLDTLTAALAYAMGIEPPAEAAAPNAARCWYGSFTVCTTKSRPSARAR